MEIHSYYCYILINCFLSFPSFISKPVSLNDIIAAEQQINYIQTPPQLKISETSTNIRKLPENYKKIIFTENSKSGFIPQTNKRLSPLKYKKTFQIRTPLRPKKIKYSYKPRSRRINTTTKRDTDNDEKFNRNYIPLLKSLSVLFNNILRTDSGDEHDSKEYSTEQRYISTNEECDCTSKSKYGSSNSKPTKKAIVITPSFTDTVPTKTKINIVATTSSSSAYNTFNDNIGPRRRNKNVSVLPARNSISSWRNHNGFSQGSLSTYHRHFKGHIARNNGSHKNNHSGRKTTESYTENYKQYSNRSSRDHASCNGTSCPAIGRNRHISSSTANEILAAETIIRSNETFGINGRDGNKFKGFDKFETRRNKTESGILLSQSSPRLRRFESQENTTEISWQIESPKESLFNVTYNFTGNQRQSNRNITMASEDQEIRRANQKLTLNDLSTNLINTSRFNLPQDKQKVVVIYDGYSIARDVNGENKLTEKAYRILS